jgi:hypothetical protein
MGDYLGMFELQAPYDARKSFYGKAYVERWDVEHGTQYVLRSYGTVVAKVTPTYADGDTETYDVELGMQYLSATTLRHVKEFLAQTDEAFKGITPAWLRKAIKDGRSIDGMESMYSKTHTVRQM